jgi:hypothetical protein
MSYPQGTHTFRCLHCKHSGVLSTVSDHFKDGMKCAKLRRRFKYKMDAQMGLPHDQWPETTLDDWIAKVGGMRLIYLRW